MSGELEKRYRGALRWYPHGWREQQGDVVISTLLDVADGECRTAPRRGELLNLAAAGIASRVGVYLPARARDQISTVALGTGAVLALVFLVVHTWSPWASWESVYAAANYSGFGPFANPGILVYGIWVVAFVVGLLRKYRVLRYMMHVAVVAPLLLRLINRLQGDFWFGPTATTLVFFSLLALGVLIGTPHRPRRIVTAAGTTLAASCMVFALNGVPRTYFVDDRFFWWAIVWTPGVALVVFAGLIIGIGLGIAKRPETAIVALGSVVPWVAIWSIGALRTDLGSTLAVMSLLLGASGVAFAGRLAIRRSRDALGSSRAAPN